MTYIELINEFWRQDRFKPFSDTDTRFYFCLLNECNIRGWLNPFELHTYDLEGKLQIKRKAIGEARNRLKQRGLIDFKAKTNNPTLYTIVNVDVSNQLFLQRNNCETIGKQLGNNCETIGKHNSIDFKDYKDCKDTTTTDNNTSLCAHTREEDQLLRFDVLLQEIRDGKHQIWTDGVRKKFGIDSVSDYLPSFRDHVIVNAKLDNVQSIQDVKSYFVCAFRYFSRLSPIQLLSQYSAAAQREDFRKYCEWIRQKAVNVAEGLVPVCEDEFRRLREVYSAKQIQETVMALNERKDLIAKYFTLYRTLIKWLANEK